MTEEVTEQIGLLAGRYQVGELLGRGGMADVHAGIDARLGRKVAIKLLRPALANDPAFRTRFRQEAQAAARMAHPTIVRVFDAGEETARDASGAELQVPFIIMEQVDGRLLKDIIADGPLPPAEAIRITEGILTALEYSHRAGVVHRDIKPGNVMVTPTGQVKVMDFGIARAISESSATLAQTSAILGTAQYFSPEQARGESVDARTDLYSTGVVLYEMLTGRAPFQADTAVAVAYQHVSEPPVAPNMLNPAISPALNAVVLRSLAKDRFERFQSAADFKQDLEIVDAGKVPDHTPAVDDFNATLFGVNPNSTAASEATLRRLAEDDSDRPPRTQSRPPVAWIWGGIAIMAVLIVGALFWVFNMAPTNLVGSGTSVTVPDVAGLTWEAGSAKLTDEGLAPVKVERTDESVADGVIISTDVDPGSTVAPGQEVQVYVSIGKPKVTLPNLAFKSEAEAKQIIADLGLVYGVTTAVYSPTVPAGVVVGAQPEGTTVPATAAVQVEQGSTVNLTVSNGLVNVPDVTGQPITQAQSTLTGGALQLTVKVQPDTTCSGQKVTFQSAKGEQPQKSTITLGYCAQ